MIGYRVLTVDDSAAMRQMIRATLAQAGLQVDEAEDAASALARLGADAAPYDLMIVDLNMPGMSGVDLVRELRRRPGHRDTPVIVLTSDPREDTRRVGLSAGADHWLLKPFRPAQLLRMVLERLDG